MKNFWLFLIIPAIMFVAFLFTPGVGYFAARDQILAREEVRKQEIAKAKAEEEQRRLEIQKRAEEDAIARQKESQAAERAREEKKRKDFEDAIGKLRDDIDGFSKETAAYTKEVAALEAKLNALRDRKETLNRETFDLSKQVEIAKIERRTAEVDIQRMIGMVSRALSESPLLVPPPPVVAPAGR